jgi:hypothetical protein
MKALEARQIVAHGETVGLVIKTIQTPGRGGRKPTRAILFRPIRGLIRFCSFTPRLAPWAPLFRRSATSKHAHIIMNLSGRGDKDLAQVAAKVNLQMPK